MNVGENIRKARLNAGLTQKVLGERCGMPESAIRKYELGMANPKFETIQRIAKALKIDTFTLIDSKEFNNQILKRTTKTIEKNIEINSYILENYGKEASIIFDRYQSANKTSQIAMFLFSQADEHTQELFSKYTQLDARGQKAVESVLLSELNSIKDSRK